MARKMALKRNTQIMFTHGSSVTYILICILIAAHETQCADRGDIVPTTFRPPSNYFKLAVNNADTPSPETSEAPDLAEDISTNLPPIYVNDTNVNYVTIQPTDGDAEQIPLATVSSIDEDEIIYVTPPFPREEEPSNTHSRDQPTNLESSTSFNGIGRRLGLAVDQTSDTLRPRVVETEGESVSSVDDWKPVWPYAELPTTASPTYLATSLLPSAETFQNNRYSVSKEPITDYYFDLAHTLVPTGGPLFNPSATVLSESLEPRPTNVFTGDSPLASEYSLLSSSVVSKLPNIATLFESPVIAPTSSASVYSTPIASFYDGIHPKEDQNVDALNAFSVTLQPSTPLFDNHQSDSREQGPTPSNSLGPIAVSNLEEESSTHEGLRPTLQSSMAESVTGEPTLLSTNTLIYSPTNVATKPTTSTTRSVNSIPVDNRIPLWKRLSQKMASSALSSAMTTISSTPTLQSFELADTMWPQLTQDDLPIGILSLRAPYEPISSALEPSEPDISGLVSTATPKLSSSVETIESTPTTNINTVESTTAPTDRTKPSTTATIPYKFSGFSANLFEEPVVKDVTDEIPQTVHVSSISDSTSVTSQNTVVESQRTSPAEHSTSSDSMHSPSPDSTPTPSLAVETFSISDVIPSSALLDLPSRSIIVTSVTDIAPNTVSSSTVIAESSLLNPDLPIGTAIKSTSTLPSLVDIDYMIDNPTTIQTDLLEGEDLLNTSNNVDASPDATLSKFPDYPLIEGSLNTENSEPMALPDLGIASETTSTQFEPSVESSVVFDPKNKLSYDLFTPTLSTATAKLEETIELVERPMQTPTFTPVPYPPTDYKASVSHQPTTSTESIPPVVVTEPIPTSSTPETKQESTPSRMHSDSNVIRTILKPSSENGQPQLHIVQMHANGTNSTKISPYVKAAISYDPIEFCKHQGNIRTLLGEWVNGHLKNETERPNYEVKIFSQPNCTSLSASESRDEDLFEKNTNLYFYVVDKGQMNPNITLQYPRNPTQLEISKELEYLKAKILHLELVSALSSGEDLMLEEEAVGTSIIAITISLALLSLFVIAGVLAFIVIKRRRAADQAHGRRCTPANDAYSMDSVSMYYHSFKRKSKKRASSKSIKSYLNQGFDDPNGPSRPLNFAKLTHFISDTEGIYDEFTGIPSISPNYDEVPRGVEDKNRYANVIPLTETRVVLKSNAKTAAEEYINANYIHGARNESKYYIATQAPLDATVEDFWQMIWEQETKVIVMLTDFVERGIDKCADYLPPSETLDCHRVYGEFQVTLKSRDMREKYVVSQVQLKNLDNNLVREVAHMWYTGWPHTGVPKEEKTFITFIFETRATRKKLRAKGPIVVHCSPGTGRTGTFIGSDISMRHFDDSKSVDIPKTVYKLRRERSGAVQTKEQYSYIYRVTNLYAAKLMTGNLDLF